MTGNLLGKLPAMKGNLVELVQTQNVKDIIQGVLDKHRETLSDYDLICEDFLGKNQWDIARKLFTYCKQNMPYREESVDLQTVRTPAATLALSSMWGADCKHYAGFIAGILDALNRNYATDIDWCYRFASYQLSNMSPGHVFVVINPGGDEIWIDPVLKSLDARNPYPLYITDKIVDMALVSISGINNKPPVRNPFAGESGHAVGAATVTDAIGTGLLSISKPLAAIPVVGWMAAGGAAVLGAILKLFGNRFENSTEVRHLIEKYQYKVLGQEIHDRALVDEGLVDEAQTWFSIVLGVPIYDYRRVYILQGSFTNLLRPIYPLNTLNPYSNPTTDPFLILKMQRYNEEMDAYQADVERVKTPEESADEYLRVINEGSNELIEENITVSRDAAIQAAIRARTLLTNEDSERGGWAAYTAAPALIATTNPDIRTDQEGLEETIALTALQTGASTELTTTNTKITAMENTATNPITAGLSGNALTLALLGGALAFGVYEANKKPKPKVGAAKDNTTLYVVGGLGLVAILFLTKKSSASGQQQLSALQQQQLQQQQYPYGGAYNQPQQQQANIWTALPAIFTTAGSIFENIWGDDD